MERLRRAKAYDDRNTTPITARNAQKQNLNFFITPPLIWSYIVSKTKTAHRD